MPEKMTSEQQMRELVVIDVTDLGELRDKALADMGYHRGNSIFRAKHSGGKLGEAEQILSIQNHAKAQRAADIIDYIRKHGKPLASLPRVTEEELLPMKNAPRDGTEILAYSEAGNFHQVQWISHERWQWKAPFSPYWGMRWHEDYRQHDANFVGWIPMPIAKLDQFTILKKR